jgi:hypothetical protein
MTKMGYIYMIPTPMDDHKYCDNVNGLLKEFLLGKLADNLEMSKVKDDALRNEIMGELRLRDKALELQAAEYKRRLEDLNHENARVMARNSDFVGIEKFEALKEVTGTNRADTLDKIGKLATGADLKALEQRFVTYQSTTETARQLASGTKLGSNKAMALVIAIVGFLWAISAVFNGGMDIYNRFSKPVEVNTSELSLLRAQQMKDMDTLRTQREATPTPTPRP